MSVEGIVVLASLPIPVLAALFMHARVYSLYRLLGERWPEIEQQLLPGAPPTATGSSGKHPEAGRRPQLLLVQFPISEPLACETASWLCGSF